jgi:hypothetical protein
MPPAVSRATPASRPDMTTYLEALLQSSRSVGMQGSARTRLCSLAKVTFVLRFFLAP